MENSFNSRIGGNAFLMLSILVIFMIVVGEVFAPLRLKLTLPPFFGISDLESFISDTAQQARHSGAMIYIQAISTTGVFLLPVILYHVIFRYDMTLEMGLRTFPPAKYWFMAIGVMLMSGLFIQWLVQINSAIPLPAKWQSLRNGQAAADKMFALFFSDPGLGRFIVLTFVAALLPAIAEEFCFRGTIMNILSKTNLGPTGGIILSGLFFSIVHSEFDNLLAIWCMGIVLGYLYYYAGSIWVSISAHFMNNFLLVAGKFAFLHGMIHMDPTGNEVLPIFITIPAGVVMLAGLALMRKWSGHRSPLSGV